MSNNCQIPTPKKYVLAMLDYMEYKEKLYGKKILENSCGEGNILCEIVERYIRSCKDENYTNSEIVHGLEQDIWAYETDKSKIVECKKRLEKIAEKYMLGNIKWNIINKDFLKSGIKNKMDYIVGNPPYITYHDMSIQQRKYLKKKYDSCKFGRFDYCYAFIEQSLKLLNDGAILTYLIPYSVLRNKFAQWIRDNILEDLVALYDYEGIQIFDNIISSSVIIVCKKHSKCSSFNYLHVKQKEKRNIRKELMSGKWFFDEVESGKRFGDYFEVANSVATLCNEAFIIKDYTIQEGVYCTKDGLRLEKELVYPAVSARSQNYKKCKPLIIFPYKIIENGGYVNIESDELKNDYPGIYNHLLEYKEKLDKRKKDKNAKWYEYGRTQAISHVIGEKLVLSMVITQKVNIYKCSKNDIPYAGYFIKAKKSKGLDLGDAMVILKSDKFMDYVKTHGTPTTASSYRISVKEIENYRFTYDKCEDEL